MTTSDCSAGSGECWSLTMASAKAIHSFACDSPVSACANWVFGIGRVSLLLQTSWSGFLLPQSAHRKPHKRRMRQRVERVAHDVLKSRSRDREAGNSHSTDRLGNFSRLVDVCVAGVAQW